MKREGVISWWYNKYPLDRATRLVVWQKRGKKMTTLEIAEWVGDMVG